MVYVCLHLFSAILTVLSSSSKIPHHIFLRNPYPRTLPKHKHGNRQEDTGQLYHANNQIDILTALVLQPRGEEQRPNKAMQDI